LKAQVKGLEEWVRLAGRAFEAFLGGDEQALSAADKAEIERAASAEPWVHEVGGISRTLAPSCLKHRP
jgi:hypothetical protein